MLARRYNELKAQNKAFEVVFVSSDHDQNSFSEYYASMPWLCIPFEGKLTSVMLFSLNCVVVLTDRARKATLSQAFGVSGIPTLILVDRTGKILDRNGRQKVFDPVFAHQLAFKVDPEVRGLTLESVIDLISTDLSLNSESTKAGYTTLVKVINNILQNPGDPKYLSLRKGNATVQSKLGNRNFIKILKIAGFTETPDAYKCSDDPDTAKLKEVRDVLSSLLLSMA
ncbi:nucleoredoxin family protein [Cystoisospora suis]|uniref:protein-disulfide reductase n=1 Tax=Cystoisospora suis TaxID=483139 RepID=A0A2C6KEI7_9APIC|nr:nucleoredoxin family protein [Cystoisospora suis]